MAGDGGDAGGFDFVSPKSTAAPEVAAFFKGVDPASGARLVAFGWAMAEDLASGKLGR